MSDNLRIIMRTSTTRIYANSQRETHPRFTHTPLRSRPHPEDRCSFKVRTPLEDTPYVFTYLRRSLIRTGSDGRSCGCQIRASYGEKVHEFLAHQGWAPTLRYCGPLCKETGLSDDFPGPAKAPRWPHLHSNMRMVVMDYIDALPWKEVPQDCS